MPDTPNRVDRAEISKRVERAEKLLQKGKAPEALNDYLAVLQDDPENDAVRQMAADLCLSMQRTTEAVKLLGELFEHQVEADDAIRASLTYKKMARYVNPTWRQKARFGQILENTNRKLAVETYEVALEEVERQGRKQDALAVLKRVVALDSSERNLLRLGELSSEVGEKKDAAAAFLQLAEATRTSGGNSGPWFERAYGEDPSDSRIALAYGKSLMAQGQVGAAIFVLEPLVQAGEALPDLAETYAKALIAANRLAEAEPLIWQMFEHNPARVPDVTNLIGLMIDAQQDTEAVNLARKLEQFQRRRGERRAFVSLMQDMASSHRASPEVLEFMSELFNSSNREADYCQTLLKLFDLHFGMGNYAKAAECLDRAAEVDAYEPGHQKRLEMLRGKIDDSRFKVIASRFTPLSKPAGEVVRSESQPTGSATLQDLMLQAEILVQYGMRSKAIERLQRIQELFPHEEERNQDLQRLYMAAGMTSRYADEAPTPPAPAASSPAPAKAAPQAAPPASGEAADVRSFTRVAEITRKLYRQSNADAVMGTAANEIGSQWKVSRCVVAMRKPGLPPTAMKERCGDGVAAGEADALAKLVAAVQDLAIARGTLTIADAGVLRSCRQRAQQSPASRSHLCWRCPSAMEPITWGCCC